MIGWHEKMCIDHGGLDADHREQHELIRRFVAAPPLDEERDPALSYLYALRIASKRHFAREEAVHRAVRYPEAREHADQHRRLLAMLDDIIQQIEQRDSPFQYGYLKGKADEVLQFWFLDHLARDDLKLKKYVLRPVRA
ncbi:bacteriohemerythrin [Azospirillum halopraeferens]|uniref:bacteriohemerythrin n=1 Tax=Azospirillum halopraeferens TaxID=34010 RepID=UPI0004227119|nr:hemerythrin family protein [Azospirillum halopraeferens]